MARMIINGTITNLTIILLAFLALGALFPTDVQATNSLSEQSRECESKFWFKNLSHFKQSIKTKCLKENHHHKEHKEMKRHQSHACNNKSHDKKALLRRWQKFSNCRCESAMGDFKGFFICYQIVQLDKVTGEFLGELSLYKKEGQHLKVGLKFSHKVKVLNDDQWRKHRGFYLSKKGPRFVEKRNRVFLQKYFVLGKISKTESMNKITLDKISPSKYLLILGNGKSRTVKSLSTKNEKVATIPFSRFIHNGLKTIILKNHQNEVPQEEKDDDNKNAKKPTEDVDKEKPVNNEDKKKQPADDGKDPVDDGKNPVDDGKNPADDGKDPADDGKDPADDGKDPADDGKDPADDGKEPTEDANEKEENEEPNPDQDPPIESPNPEYEPDKGSDGDQPKTGNADEKDGSQDNPEELNKGKDEKDEEDKKVPSGKESLMRAGGLIVGCVVAVGSIFVAFNTYERRRLRNMQRNFVHNPSLANVPDYNGYGRAH